ncbi:MAG: hypothetical protein JOZ14_12425, partial [Acidobacteria bacterium]|nr:hypothetical protein [Acidobacteriota bacterium]
PPAVLEPPYIGTFNAFVSDHALPRTYQWNLTLDQNLGSSQTLSASYVGELGRRLLRQNLLFGSPNPLFNNSYIWITTNASSSNYQALQLQFRRHLSRGLATLVSYTWSHSIDDTSTDVGLDNFVKPALDRGPSDFDVRHAFNAAFAYSVPSPAGVNPALGAMLKNWLVAGIWGVKTALPVNVTVGRSDTGTDPSFSPYNTRPDLIPGVPLYIDEPSLPGGRGINPAAFSVPAEIRQGDLGRNALRAFPQVQTDFAIQRQFRLGEKIKLDWRADFFNLVNHPSFYIDGTLGYYPPFASNPTFGSGVVMVAPPRQIQFALKVDF